jgi:hypothetical protein
VIEISGDCTRERFEARRNGVLPLSLPDHRKPVDVREVLRVEFDFVTVSSSPL